MDVEKIPKIVTKYYKDMSIEIERKTMPKPIYFIKTPNFEQSDLCYLMYGWYVQQTPYIKDDILSPIKGDKTKYLQKIRLIDWKRPFVEKVTAKEIFESL